MARQERQPFKEDPPPGVPAWMLTFCDCMTLLLTFFVLLLSFSSFDEAALRRLLGAMKFKSAVSISKKQTETDASLATEVQPLIDRTDKGAEKKRPFENQKVVKNPKEAETPHETDAYHEEAVLSIPLDRLFLGDSTVLTLWGRDGLNRIASHLKLMPCYVIIGESLPHRASSRSVGSADAGLLRSWEVLRFFTQRQGLQPARFWISGEPPRPLQSEKEKPTMQIVLLARDVTRFPTKNKG